MLAKGLSNYLRNRNTGAPLVLGITGEGGSGKSSLMNLLRGDLESRGFFPVWFNAWHHQQEEHLLAALLQNIRSQAIPGWLTREGILFRLKLMQQRYRRRWQMLVLGGAFGAAAITWLYHAAPSLSNVQWPELESLSLTTALLSFLRLLPFGSAIPALLILRKFLQAFGADPSRLALRSEGKAGAKDLREQTSFRYRFSNEFREVTRALRPRTMVIFVDDLDRCQPDHMMTVLESINFLATSGDCFIVVGMEEKAVLDCLSTRLTWRLETEKKEMTDGEKLQARREYAQLWLEKLIQVKIPVPPLTPQLAQSIVRGEEGVMLLQSLGWSKQLRRRGLQVAFVALVAVVLAAGWRIGEWLPQLPRGAPDAANGQDIPVWLNGLVLNAERDGESWQVTASRQGPSGSAASVPQPGVASPGYGGTEGADPGPPPPSPEPPRAVGGVTPGQTDDSMPWVFLVLIAIAVLAAGGLGLAQRPQVQVDDSEDFRAAIDKWWPIIQQTYSTPRSLKRFLNRLRLNAMLVRNADLPEARPRISERMIVGFGVIQSRWPEALQSAFDREAVAPGASSTQAALLEGTDATLPEELQTEADQVVSYMKNQADARDFQRLSETIHLAA